MNELWSHRIAPSIESPEAAIRPMGWEEAQAWCNFVVMRPGELPAGLALTRAEMRPEAPPGRYPGMDRYGRFTHGISNRASYRAEFAGEGRRLEIKQIFYDLGPPAFDHPSFWLNQGRAFPVGDHIGWLGKDFRDRQAASLDIDRTTVEVAALEGCFSDEELAGLCAGLRPAVAPARRAILGTPLADLYYQRRYKDLIITVPMGFWHHRRRPPSLRTTVLRSAELPGRLAGSQLALPSWGGFALDTVILFGAPEQPQEIEWIYERRDRPGHTARILSWPAGAPTSLPFPPTCDRQPCSTRVDEMHGRPVYRAFVDGRYGQHEAVWQRGGLTLMMMVKAAPWTDRDWFRQFLDEVDRHD